MRTSRQPEKTLYSDLLHLMAGTTTYQQTSDEKAGTRLSIREMFAEMDRLLAEMKRSREIGKNVDTEIDASLNNIDAVLARLAAG